MLLFALYLLKTAAVSDAYYIPKGGRTVDIVGVAANSSREEETPLLWAIFR